MYESLTGDKLMRLQTKKPEHGNEKGPQREKLYLF